MKRTTSLGVVAATLLTTLAGISAVASGQNGDDKKFHFQMMRGAKLVNSGCLPNATANVKIKHGGPVEIMDVNVAGLPPNTDFDFFVIQKPGAPFGLAWYQGDIETGDDGEGHGSSSDASTKRRSSLRRPPTAAPLVHNNAFPDAGVNPTTIPIHTYHLGLWFNSSADAANAGCPADVTPFNGEHNAGIQVLNTSNFADLQGPLFFVKP